MATDPETGRFIKAIPTWEPGPDKDTAWLPLSRGRMALIDLEFAKQNPHKYSCQAKGHRRSEYAFRNIHRSASNKRQFLHRDVMEWHLGRPLGPEEQIDHINHDGLDNRVSNLRLCTNSQNHHAKPKNRTKNGQPCSSQYKGVSWHKGNSKWRAYINIDGRRINLGSFTSELDAARAYDEAARGRYGPYAVLNRSQ